MKFSVTEKRNRKRIFLISLAVLCALILTWLVVPSKPGPIQNLGDSWVFQENQTGPVIGDLGGVPVSIPRPYAHFVEYDGDPHFMERRKGPPPKRTFQSRLASFGFEIRYPDMAALTDETAKQQKQETIYTTTWMRVGISSGSDYGSDDVLDAYVNYMVNLKQKFPPYRYEKLPDAVFGLTAYAPVGFDELKRGIPGGTGYNDMNVYFHRNREGKADAYIECSNVLHAAARCELKFNMLPAMRANIFVGFRKGLLPHWKEIQSLVTQVILGFQVNPSSTATQQRK